MTQVFEFPPAKAAAPAKTVFPIMFPSATESAAYWAQIRVQAQQIKEYGTAGITDIRDAYFYARLKLEGRE